MKKIQPKAKKTQQTSIVNRGKCFFSLIFFTLYFLNNAKCVQPHP
jgi:hypothetical protein